jgi:signal peptidase I
MKENKSANILCPILLAMAAALVLKLFFVDVTLAEGASMAPAVKNGAVLVVSRLAYGFRPPLSGRYLCRWAEPAAGDVVVFYTPYGELAVKRCAEVRDGGLFVALGDNSASSFDSRSYGPVPLDNILGRVLGIRKAR